MAWKTIHIVLSHNSYAQNVAHSLTQKQGIVFLMCKLSEKCFCPSSDHVAEWVELHKHPLCQAEMEVMLLDLTRPLKKRCAWLSGELSVRKAFYCLFAPHWALLSLWKEKKLSREAVISSGWFGLSGSSLLPSSSQHALHLQATGKRSAGRRWYLSVCGRQSFSQCLLNTFTVSWNPKYSVYLSLLKMPSFFCTPQGK